jgi:hypothetical protein
MEEVELPQPVRIRIREYFRHRYNSGSLQAAKNVEILEFLSPALQEAIATHTHAGWIRDIKYFTNCPDDFVTRVAMCLENHTFAPHEVIIHLGEEANNLYIVKAGVCAAKGVIFTQGKVFGDDMITSVTKPELVSSRGYQARSLTFSDVYDLPKESLVELLEQHPAIFEEVRKLAIKFIFRESVLGYNNAVKNLMTGNRVFTQDRNLVEQYENKLALLLPRDGGDEKLDTDAQDEAVVVKELMKKKLNGDTTNGMGSEAQLVVSELQKVAASLKGLQDRVNGLDGGSNLLQRIEQIEAKQMLESGVPVLSDPPPGNKFQRDVAKQNEKTAEEIDPSLDWAPQSITSPQQPKSTKSGVVAADTAVPPGMESPKSP